MKVKELLKELTMMSPEAKVVHLYDGEIRTEIAHVYMSKKGYCVTADNEMISYSDSGRPLCGPSKEEMLIWHTPKQPTNFKADVKNKSIFSFLSIFIRKIRKL